MAPSAEPGRDFLSFVNASPSPYHAVQGVRERLEKAGFQQLLERDDWSECKPGGKYYITRNASTIAAWTVGHKWSPGGPIAMIGAHTDSPCLRIKPVSQHKSEGFLQVGVETYGGGLWHTWFDRDLGVAGRIIIKSKRGDFVQKLVDLRRPILRIPTLAIHLSRQENFEFSKEVNLFPIAGMVEAELERLSASNHHEPPQEGQAKGENKADDPVELSSGLKALKERHHPRLIELVAENVGIDPEQIQDFELVLYDTQKACTGGLNDELIYSARLDNLEMSYCSAIALINSVESAALENEPCIRLVALFDHEEIGSMSAQGAQSNLLPSLIRRLSVLPGSSSGATEANGDNAAYERSLATSFLISADMAHSVHPNYAGKYEAKHKPVINQGAVLKINANQRYATNSPGIVLLQEVARTANVPLQVLVVRNDSPCGSTIGPMLSSSLGIRTLDLGNPQLSMHSIRETGGLYDVDHAIKLFTSFFSDYSVLEKKIFIDT